MQYEAFWLPGLNSDEGPDEILRVGDAWLRESGQIPVIVLNALKMVHNRPTLFRIAQSAHVAAPTSRTRPPMGPRSVLAVWPANRTLELAEMLALRGRLCVIPGTIDDMTPWIQRAQARNLLAPDDPAPALPELHPEAREHLDRALFFGGHNGFAGGGEKDDIVRRMRHFVAQGHRPPPDAIEAYLRASTQLHRPDGARRAREWYEAILAGRRLKGERGQYI